MIFANIKKFKFQCFNIEKVAQSDYSEKINYLLLSQVSSLRRVYKGLSLTFNFTLYLKLN
jgi:hypothetical protein